MNPQRDEPADREPSWWRIVAAGTGRGTLVLLGTLLAFALVPTVVGLWSTVVVTGSMSPALDPGDVMVGRHVDTDDLRPGQVLLVDDPDHEGVLRSHRLVTVRPDGDLVLRGDANAHADSTPVRPEAVHGVGVLAVPAIGSPSVWWRENDWSTLAVAAALLGLAGWSLRLDRPMPESRVAAPSHRGQPLPPGASVVTGGVATGLLIAASLATVLVPHWSSSAAFAAQTETPADLSTSSQLHPYRDAVLADDPLLYWRLADTTTTAADSSGNGRVGTYYGSYAQQQPSVLLNQPTDRSTSYTTGMVTADASSTAPTSFTVEAWVRTTTTAGGRILGFGPGSGSTLSGGGTRQLYLSPSGQFVFGVGTPLLDSVIVSSAGYADGQWHHVVGTYTPPIILTGTVRLFVDGVQVATDTVVGPLGASGYWRAAAENLDSAPNAPSGAWLAADLDELAVYPTALSLARVQAHYAARSA